MPRQCMIFLFNERTWAALCKQFQRRTDHGFPGLIQWLFMLPASVAESDGCAMLRNQIEGQVAKPFFQCSAIATTDNRCIRFCVGRNDIEQVDQVRVWNGQPWMARIRYERSIIIEEQMASSRLFKSRTDVQQFILRKV